MKRLDAEFAAGPRALSDRYRTWATKYAVPLVVLDSRRSDGRGPLQRLPEGPRLCVRQLSGSATYWNE